MSARTIAAALAVVAVLAAAAGGVAATTQQDSDANTTIDYTGDRVTIPPERYAVVSGDTGFQPPTNVTIRASSSAEDFPKSKKVMVQTDGSFAETLDFSGVETGTTGTLTVVGPDGAELASAEFIVRESTPTASPTATDSPTPSESPTGTSSPTSTGQPGFGTLAALSAALVVGLLAARSRR